MSEVIEKWQIINLLEDRNCRIHSIDELDNHIHWKLMLVTETDKIYYVGIDFQNIEMVFKEVDE